MKDRLDPLRHKIQELGLDALLVSMPENRRYLSGFTGSAGYLLITPTEALLATDFRYVEQALGQAPHFQVVRIGSDWSWLKERVAELRLKRLGVEGQHMTLTTHKQIVEAFKELPSKEKSSLVVTTGMVDPQRAVKDSEELALLQKAIDIAETALEQVISQLRPEQTEKEVAWHLERTMRDLGADGPSFDTIVAAGPHGAMPHHRPSDRPIAQGEPVVIDMGARVSGYCSDITRTVCLGEPNDTFRRIYDTVLGAQLTAIELIKPGMTGDQGDAFARRVIEESGHGESFGHSLGHGVGLAVHELPRLAPKSTHTLEEGMVFTIEPGIYLSGWGGVRIEDMVLLGANGVEVLSRAKK